MYRSWQSILFIVVIAVLVLALGRSGQAADAGLVSSSPAALPMGVASGAPSTGPDPRLVGSWETKGGQFTYTPDGRFSGTEEGHACKGTYTATNGHLSLVSDTTDMGFDPFDFSFDSKGRLTLLYNGTVSSVWDRVAEKTIGGAASTPSPTASRSP